MSLAIFALATAMVTQQPPAEAARLYDAYPQAQFSPLFKDSLETFLRVEAAYKAAKYAEADRLLKQFWERRPPGTEAWAAANHEAGAISRATGINAGHPTCYYALRMLTECVSWKLSGKPAPRSSGTATLSVVLVGKAVGVEPRTKAELDAKTGQMVERDLEKRLLADNYKVIRESTWLLQEYVEAATMGELKVQLNFVPLPNLKAQVETTWQGRGMSGLTGHAWGQIWDAIPAGQRRKTDWWWVLYPSAVPDAHPDFKTTEFVTGGMGVGPDGASPCFIIDDKWLTRRPPHLGQGTYTEVERRAYLPQWFQHEFFHHLFRIYPEHKLEVDGHDWFDPQKWPKDFQGRLEPDYYAEALRLRFKGSKPSLATRLRYAGPPEDVLLQVSVNDLLGEYRHEPEQNGWHRGTLALEKDGSGRLRWTNTAGASWLLVPKLKDGVLQTGPDCPYYPQNPFFTVVLKQDEQGRHLPHVIGFNFGGSFYRRV